MIMTAAVCGAGVGVGVALVVRGYLPARPSLRAILDGVDRRTAVQHETQSPDLIDRLGRRFVPVAQSLGLSSNRLAADLAMIDRSPERHLTEKVALAIVGFALVPLVALALAIGGLPVPLAVPLWLAVVVGVVFFVIPDAGVRSDAEVKRREFRHSLGAFLDLVVIGLAGGGGVESALDAATEIGDGWVFARLRTTLSDARLRGDSPWVALGNLGERVGVTELIELAASVGLAGTEGAKVRASLTAKAQSLRQHQLAETESAAQSASEQMSIPVVLLFGGFLLFIAYPAVSQVLTGL